MICLLYTSTSTDFEGSAGPASDQVNAFLEESVQLSETVMGDAAYSLWNYNNVAAMKNLSSRYLFNIEEEASNPAGAGRATNKEFIIASVYSLSLIHIYMVAVLKWTAG